MRTTYTLVLVATAMMDDPSGRHWGYELSRKCGIRSGVLYPILQRMLNSGWVADGWESAGEVDGKRPPRRYYRLTPVGVTSLSEVLEHARREVRFQGLIPGLAS